MAAADQATITNQSLTKQEGEHTNIQEESGAAIMIDDISNFSDENVNQSVANVKNEATVSEDGESIG